MSKGKSRVTKKYHPVWLKRPDRVQLDRLAKADKRESPDEVAWLVSEELSRRGENA